MICVYFSISLNATELITVELSYILLLFVYTNFQYGYVFFFYIHSYNIYIMIVLHYIHITAVCYS